LPVLPNTVLRRIRHSSFLLPTSLTAYLWLKGLHPDLPGWPCPLRALTGIPCPTCFLTRATSDALSGDLSGSLRLHAFGPLAAAALIGWSVVAIQQRRLVPQGLPAWPLGLSAAGLLLYWLLRLWLRFGLGVRGFPAFPELN
jgi:hypothetical protein